MHAGTFIKITKGYACVNLCQATLITIKEYFLYHLFIFQMRSSFRLNNVTSCLLEVVVEECQFGDRADTCKKLCEQL